MNEIFINIIFVSTRYKQMTTRDDKKSELNSSSNLIHLKNTLTQEIYPPLNLWWTQLTSSWNILLKFVGLLARVSQAVHSLAFLFSLPCSLSFSLWCDTSTQTCTQCTLKTQASWKHKPSIKLIDIVNHNSK